MKDKEIVFAKINIKDLFPTKDNPSSNGHYFTEEAIENAVKDICGIPFIAKVDDKEVPVGIVSDVKDENILFIEMEPEIEFFESEDANGIKVIKHFDVRAINLKF